MDMTADFMHLHGVLRWIGAGIAMQTLRLITLPASVANSGLLVSHGMSVTWLIPILDSAAPISVRFTVVSAKVLSASKFPGPVISPEWGKAPGTWTELIVMHGIMVSVCWSTVDIVSAMPSTWQSHSVLFHLETRITGIMAPESGIRTVTCILKRKS